MPDTMSNHEKMTREIFIRVSAQSENLGDLILRRGMLNALRPIGQLHVLVDRSPDHFIKPLTHQSDIIYRDVSKWTSRARLLATNGNAVIAVNPGEIRADGPRLIGHIKQMALAWFIRLHGGTGIMAGAGLKSLPGLAQRIGMRIAFSPYRPLIWRDLGSQKAMGIGQIMPDWAFGEPTITKPNDAEALRDKLVVSLRSDRPYPSQEWRDEVRKFASIKQLKIVVVTQVTRDESRSRQLSNDLAGHLVEWDEMAFDRMEKELRTIYSQAAIVLSDRLHVLIVGASEGAVPVCLVEFEETKINRHFETINYSGVSEKVRPLRAGAIMERLDTHLLRRDELMAAIGQAKYDVSRIASGIQWRLSIQASTKRVFP